MFELRSESCLLRRSRSRLVSASSPNHIAREAERPTDEMWEVLFEKLDRDGGGSLDLEEVTVGVRKTLKMSRTEVSDKVRRRRRALSCRRRRHGRRCRRRCVNRRRRRRRVCRRRRRVNRRRTCARPTRSDAVVAARG